MSTKMSTKKRKNVLAKIAKLKTELSVDCDHSRYNVVSSNIEAVFDPFNNDAHERVSKFKCCDCGTTWKTFKSVKTRRSNGSLVVLG